MERLIVFACIASVALAASASASGILFALRGFRLARGRLGARAVAGVYLVFSVATGVG